MTVPNMKSTKAGKVSVSKKLKTPIKGNVASMYHASRGKTAPKLTDF